MRQLKDIDLPRDWTEKWKYNFFFAEPGLSQEYRILHFEPAIPQIGIILLAKQTIICFAVGVR